MDTSPAPADDSEVASAAAPAPAQVSATTATPTTTATSAPTASAEPTATPDPGQPDIDHAFVIWLAGHGAAATYAPDSPATFLNGELRRQGTVLAAYDGLGQGGVADGLAIVAGRPPDAASRGGCAAGCDFRDGSVASLADRLAETGGETRAYQGDPCDAPVRRDPLSSFGTECRPLEQLSVDLAKTDTTAGLTFIAPAACDAGETGACPPGEPDGLAREDALLARVAPAILQSPAYADNGLLLVVFDAGGPAGPAGDPASALVVSPFAASNAMSQQTYGPYAVSRTLADVLGVEPLGRAAGKTVKPFGGDVWASDGR